MQDIAFVQVRVRTENANDTIDCSIHGPSELAEELGSGIRKGICRERSHCHFGNAIQVAPEERFGEKQYVPARKKHILIWRSGRWNSDSREAPVIAIQIPHRLFEDRQRTENRRLYCREEPVQVSLLGGFPIKSRAYVERVNNGVCLCGFRKQNRAIETAANEHGER
jgi:hypothetical protein